MLTKGAIGNLVNRYRAVLTKCNLINTFGSLAVASMLVLGGAGVANAAEVTETINAKDIFVTDSLTVNVESGRGINAEGVAGVATVKLSGDLNVNSDQEGIYAKILGDKKEVPLTITAKNIYVTSKNSHGIYVGSPDGADYTPSTFTFGTAEDMEISSGAGKYGIFIDNGGYKTTTNINVGGLLDVDGTVYVKNGKPTKITAGSINIESDDKFGIRSENASMEIDVDGDIEVKAKEQGIYATCDNPAYSTGLSVSAENLKVEAENALHTQVNGKLNIDVANDIDLTGNVRTEQSCEINIESGNDITINGDIKKQDKVYVGGQVTILAANNITVNGDVVAEGGEGFGKYPYVGVKAGGDVVINGELAAHWAQGNKDEERAYGLEIEGQNVTVNSGEGKLLYNGAGSTNIVAVEQLSLTGKKGLENEGGSFSVSAETVNITGEEFAILAHTGTSSIETSGSSNINGNIKVAGAQAVVNVDLGEGGSFIGSVIDKHFDETAGVYLDLGEGSVWNATGPSTVTSLAGDDITVNMDAGANVEAVSYSGNGGTINMVDAESSFTAKSDDASEASFKVQAIDAEGNVLNADGVSAATLAAMMANVDVTDAEGNAAATTASADKGIVNNGFTITTDENGKPVVTGGGVTSVTEAVLESASINTVALTHILTNDVRKRLGDIRADQNKTGVWMRWDGGKLKGDSGLTNNFNTIQIGGDTKAAKNCRIGFAGSFTHGDGDFNRGSSELEGFSFALYGTWMGENGMFADVVARLGKFSTEMNVEGLKGDMDNRVASLSGEYGWRFNLAQQFFVEPQVELAYTYVSSDDLNLGNARFAFDSVDSLTGRAGVLFGWNLPEERGNVYARASVLQQFMGDAKVTGYSGVAPTVHEIDGEDTWLEYGIGANVKLTDNTYVWADVERTEGADIEEEWRGTVGIRYSF